MGRRACQRLVDRKWFLPGAKGRRRFVGGLGLGTDADHGDVIGELRAVREAHETLVGYHLTELAEHELTAAFGDQQIQLVALGQHERKGFLDDHWAVHELWLGCQQGYGDLVACQLAKRKQPLEPVESLGLEDSKVGDSELMDPAKR